MNQEARLAQSVEHETLNSQEWSQGRGFEPHVGRPPSELMTIWWSWRCSSINTRHFREKKLQRSSFYFIYLFLPLFVYFAFPWTIWWSWRCSSINTRYCSFERRNFDEALFFYLFFTFLRSFSMFLSVAKTSGRVPKLQKTSINLCFCGLLPLTPETSHWIAVANLDVILLALILEI